MNEAVSCTLAESSQEREGWCWDEKVVSQFQFSGIWECLPTSNSLSQSADFMRRYFSTPATKSTDADVTSSRYDSRRENLNLWIKHIYMYLLETSPKCVNLH